MTRPIYLIIYTSTLFPAHWSLWIPSLSDPSIGKRLHAEGDAATGFKTVFERGYVLHEDTRKYQCLLLGEVSDEYVLDVDGQECDSIAHDDLERILLSVPAPGASLVSSESQVCECVPCVYACICACFRRQGPRKRVRIQNCRTWLRDGTAALVKSGIMDGMALQRVEGAPKN